MFKSNEHCHCGEDEQPQAFSFTCVNTLDIVSDVCHYEIKHPPLVNINDHERRTLLSGLTVMCPT